MAPQTITKNESCAVDRSRPRWNGPPLGFTPRASHPADQEPHDARRGGDRPSSTDMELSAQLTSDLTPMWPAFPTSEYYDPLRLPLDHPMPLPGFAGYRPGIASRRSRRPTGPRRLSRVPRTTVRTFIAQIRRRVPQRPLLEQERFPWPSPCADRLGTLNDPPEGGPLNDACSGFTHVADRTIDPAPLRTRPLDHARGHHYRGPRRLPGPDSHRQAAPNLSPLRHVDLPFFMAPRQSRRTRA
jgi:hypothetical protein